MNREMRKKDIGKKEKRKGLKIIHKEGGNKISKKTRRNGKETRRR